jgi:hypothetical protein
MPGSGVLSELLAWLQFGDDELGLEHIAVGGHTDAQNDSEARYIPTHLLRPYSRLTVPWFEAKSGRWASS